MQVAEGVFELSPGTLSTVELLRRDTFKEWKWDKELVKVQLSEEFVKKDL